MLIKNNGKILDDFAKFVFQINMKIKYKKKFHHKINFK